MPSFKQQFKAARANRGVGYQQPCCVWLWGELLGFLVVVDSVLLKVLAGCPWLGCDRECCNNEPKFSLCFSNYNLLGIITGKALENSTERICLFLFKTPSIFIHVLLRICGCKGWLFHEQDFQPNLHVDELSPSWAIHCLGHRFIIHRAAAHHSIHGGLCLNPRNGPCALVLFTVSFTPGH